MELIVHDKHLQIEGVSESAVANTDGPHRLVTQRIDVKHVAMPCKHRVGLQVQVGHHICIGVDFMFAATSHLLLILLQQLQHGGVTGKLGIDRKRLYRHTHRVQETLIGATIINGGKQ